MSPAQIREQRVNTRAFRWMLWTVLAGCDCGADLRVEGDTPWIRCAEYESDDREISGLGRIEERQLYIDGVERIEIFAVDAESLAWFEGNDEPCGDGCIQWVLGGAGGVMSAEIQEAIAARGAALILAGGGDQPSRLDNLGATSLDLRGVRGVELGGVPFLTIGGTERGRYGHEACGFDDSDLNELSAERASWVVSWEAPRRTGNDPIDQGLLGMHIGSELLARWMSEHTVIGSLHAYPREAAGRQSGGDAPSFVVPVLGRLHIDVDGVRRMGVPLVLALRDGEWVPVTPL